ncbi:MAG: hypothetical protein JRF02_06645 [Deltaproteobacteria bacterium]|jgi:predicted regulator of amino acid metabolism with ACT domain|nr:hypothetical protein [Deltaproteobacteria bacterium]
MRKRILIFVSVLLSLGISAICSAWHQDVYKSVYIARLTADQFLSVNMPKDMCAPWVMWETGNPEIPRVTIIHVAEHNRRPRLHVISPVLNEEAFQGILEEIRGFWNATGIGPITRTIEGDLVAIITFPGHTIDMEGNSVMTISNTILFNVKEHEVFLGQIDEFVRDKDIYRNSTIDLWCNNLPADMVNNFPYPDQMVAR